MINIVKIPIQVSRNTVNDFLNDLKSILNSNQFDVNRDFLLIRNRTPHGIHGYSTPQTLLDLDYAVEDVVERLKEAGKLMGVDLIDFVIVGESYYSYHQAMKL